MKRDIVLTDNQINCSNKLERFRRHVLALSSHSRLQAQSGYIMMALALAVALTVIGLAAAVPMITTELRRDKEEELIHRGVEYSRAIRLYYRRFRTYPLSVDQLIETNHIRFLRKRYQDPITRADFRLLHAGEVQLSFRKSALPGQNPTPGFNAFSPGNNAPDASQSASVGMRQNVQPIFPAQLLEPQAAPTGPVIGVASTSEKQSVHVFNDGDHYKDWLFVYTPAIDRGGLFARPFDGIPGNTILLNNPSPGASPGGLSTAPGVPLPSNLHR